MNARHWKLSLGAAIAAILSNPLFALDNSFTYQGVMDDAGQPATGFYDFNLSLFSTTGTALAAPVFFDNVEVKAGVFTVPLAFGYQFGSVDTELELAVRAGVSTGGFTTLLPRQRIRAVPYAQHAERVPAGSIGGIEIANGAVGAADVDAGQVQLRVASGCGAGQALSGVAADGTVTCTAAGAGDITSISTPLAGGLTGGGPAGDLSLAIAAGGVDSSHIKNLSITDIDIAANAISGLSIATDSIAAVDIGPNAVATSEILDASVTLPKVSAAGSTAGQVLASTGTAATWVTPQPRRFYATKAQAIGSSADIACAAGFHFASIWEIVDVGSLSYDTTLGLTLADSGNGPPFAAGWVRTGAVGNTSGNRANCNAWTDGTAAALGTIATSEVDPALQSVGPWKLNQVACSTAIRSWCIED